MMMACATWAGCCSYSIVEYMFSGVTGDIWRVGPTAMNVCMCVAFVFGRVCVCASVIFRMMRSQCALAIAERRHTDIRFTRLFSASLSVVLSVV